MLKKMLSDFFLGILISFTLSALFVTTVYTFKAAGNIPAPLIWQCLILSALCSLINLVYRMEKLSFLKQSVIGYLLTTSTIMLCGFQFGWTKAAGNSFNKTSALFILFLIYSLSYLFTWIIIWQFNKAKKRKINDKLKAYKQRQLQ